MAVFAPIPSARVTTAVHMKPRFFRKVLNANRRSCSIAAISCIRNSTAAWRDNSAECMNLRKTTPLLDSRFLSDSGMTETGSEQLRNLAPQAAHRPNDVSWGAWRQTASSLSVCAIFDGPIGCTGPPRRYVVTQQFAWMGGRQFLTAQPIPFLPRG